MCGVFGFVSYDGKGPDLKTLGKIAEVTQTRGQHAFGFAWLDWQGRLKMFKRTGRITDHLGFLAMARNARVLIGHCRWATHGDYRNNLNNHPHPADGGWIVHNGVVRNHEELAAEYDLHTVTQCDSEVLGLLVGASHGTLQKRSAAAAHVAEGPLVTLGVWGKPARLVAVRRGNPLHVGEVRGGERFYLGSLAACLPGLVREVPDGSGVEWTPSQMIAFDVGGEPQVS